MPEGKRPYDVWVWVELIGFDNEQPDYGVKAYLDNAGLVPDAMSLFVFNPDFVHTHDGVERDRAFPFDYSTYGGHPSSYERQRQDWTRRQLLGLVRELQRHGIAVFFSVFDVFASDEWIGGHPELLHLTRNGDRTASICPWKRFPDGSYYEDFLAQQLRAVLRDYGFDGFHQPDGLSHPRLPVYEGDYSDDLVGQFVTATGVALPDGLAEPSGNAPEVIRKRADWIWRHRRREWIRFYAERVQRFCRKVAEAAHAEGKRVFPNNALTRDPFQALYRYGVDYRRLAEAGVDGLIVETVAPGVAIGAESGMEVNPHYDYLAMLLLIKAHVPHLELHCLNNAHDVNEQWDVLRHGPALLEREIYCQSNLYRWRADGTLERCSAGPMVCLGDGIRRCEWEWMRDWWDRAFSVTPRRVIGATVVWSDRTLAPQLDAFIETRAWSTHKLVYELMSRGAPIYCAVRVEDLGGVSGPLLVPNPQLFSEEELAAILAYDRGPIIAIGGKTAALPTAGFSFEDCCPPHQLACSVYGTEARWEMPVEAGPNGLAGEDAGAPGDDVLGIEEPLYFVQELYFRKVSESFLAGCVRVIADCAGAVKVLRRAEVIRVQALELADGRVRLLIGNDSHYYVITELDLGREIEGLKVVTLFPGTTPVPAGSRFGCRVPGKGMVVVEVTLKD